MGYAPSLGAHNPKKITSFNFLTFVGLLRPRYYLPVNHGESRHEPIRATAP